MSIELIRKRLNSYKLTSKEGELNAIKEIFQEIALCALSRTDFFKNSAFMGGTCLRILHGLSRFSEDLDFALLSPDRAFRWSSLLDSLSLEFEAYNLHLEVQDREDATNAVKKAFLKEDSFGKALQLTYERKKSDVQKVLIKLEVDTNPPAGAHSESVMVRFPFPFSVRAHNLPSLCAGKCLALLCRKFHKGRDWFDFLWYVSQNIVPNFEMLSSGLKQQGPWKGKVLSVNDTWLLDALHSKVSEVDWTAARDEVRPFLSGPDLANLRNWSQDYFHQNVDLFLRLPHV